jgi:predicted acyltransferase
MSRIVTATADPASVPSPAATAAEIPLSPPPRPVITDRYPSVDALRGLVMFTMLFVNDVAGVHGIPKWMKHAPDKANAMTFVDWVFPAFLFIVGMSIPLAFANRLKRGEPMWRLLLHVLTRTGGLLLLGVLMVNGEEDPVIPGWPNHLWEMLVYAFGILAFLALPGKTRAARGVNIVLRVIGFAGLAMLAFVFRDHHGVGLRPHWWGILGLIGWAYLVASILYLLLRNHRDWMIAFVAILTAMFIADRNGLFDHVWINNYVGLGDTLGSQAAITLAGAVLGSVLLTRDEHPIRYALGFGSILSIAALLMHPKYGINKNAATPSWCLICSALTCWLWAAMSMPIDRLRIIRPFNFFIRGGQNVLLAYLIMPLFLHFIWMMDWNFYGHLGATPAMGITRSLLAAAFVLWLAGALKDRGVRLRL